MLAERRGDPALAESQYRTALTMDPYFLPAHFNLANLLSRLERHEDAERVLRDGIARVPEEGELHYSLGLLLAESERMNDAVKSLGRAAELLPERSRVHYNLGLALQQIGRGAESERALVRAERLAPNDAEVVHALVLHYVAAKQWERAEHQGEKLVRLRPQARDAMLMLEQIRAFRRYGTKK